MRPEQRQTLIDGAKRLLARDDLSERRRANLAEAVRLGEWAQKTEARIAELKAAPPAAVEPKA